MTDTSETVDYDARRSMLTSALRSGEYRQAQHTLQVDGAFCCLGVACDIYLKETGKGSWGDSKRYFYDGVGDDSKTRLPAAVRDWYGFRTQYGSFGDPDRGESRRLSIENDNGATFMSIADLIDSKPMGLFND